MPDIPGAPGERRGGVPVEVIFNPNWWFRNYGIRFDESFYFDREMRIRNDVKMRSALYQRFGVGVPDPAPRPVVGSDQVAGGFVVPALLGVEVRFTENQAPWQVPRELSREAVFALRVPEIENTWPMSRLIEDMDWLEQQFGYVAGDFNTDGILNTALQLRRQQFFLDLLEDPEPGEVPEVRGAVHADRLDQVVHQILTTVRRHKEASLPGLGRFTQGPDGKVAFEREGGRRRG